MSGAAHATTPGHRPLPQRGTPCLAKLTRSRSWTGTIAVLVDDLAIGIRVDSDRTRETVENSLAAKRVPEADRDVAPNFSVELPCTASGAVRRFNVVYQDHNLVARRTDVDELMRDLTDLVTATRNRYQTDAIAVQATVVLRRDMTVVLFPPAWHRTLVLHRDRLSAHGLELLTPSSHVIQAPRESNGPPAAVLRTSRGGTALEAPVEIWGVKASDLASGMIRPGPAVLKTFGYVENRRAVGAGRVLKDLAAIASTTPVAALGNVSGLTLMRTAVELATTGRPDRL